MFQGGEGFTQLIQKITPSWTKNIGSSPKWKERVCSALPLDHIHLSDITKKPDFGFDAVYCSGENIPRDVHGFISLFGLIAEGGLAVLELDKGSGNSSFKWSRKVISNIGSGLGMELRFFGPLSKANSSYGKFPKSKSGKINLAIFDKPCQRSSKKKLSIILPILEENRKHKRILEWIRFAKSADLLPVIEILLVFDGIHDALPVWKEYDLLAEENGFQMIRHYTPFGTGQCIRSGLHFARGTFLLCDCLPHASCSEIFCLLEPFLSTPYKTEAGGVFSQEILDGNIIRKGRKDRWAPFLLVNRPAGKIIRKNTQERDLSMFEEAWIALKKSKANLFHIPISTFPTSEI